MSRLVPPNPGRRRVDRGPRRFAAVPQVGDVIYGATGPETVLAVLRGGLRLLVQDEAGRTWTRERAEHGSWVLAA